MLNLRRSKFGKIVNVTTLSPKLVVLSFCFYLSIIQNSSCAAAIAAIPTFKNRGLVKAGTPSPTASTSGAHNDTKGGGGVVFCQGVYDKQVLHQLEQGRVIPLTFTLLMRISRVYQTSS